LLAGAGGASVERKTGRGGHLWSLAFDSSRELGEYDTPRLGEVVVTSSTSWRESSPACSLGQECLGELVERRSWSW